MSLGNGYNMRRTHCTKDKPHLSNVNQMYKSEASSGHVSTYGNVDQVDAGLQLSKAEMQKGFWASWAPDGRAPDNWVQRPTATTLF